MKNYDNFNIVEIIKMLELVNLQAFSKLLNGAKEDKYEKKSLLYTMI